MHLIIASMALLAFVAAVRTQNRTFPALIARPALAAGTYHAAAPQTDAGGWSRRQDGFSGSFDVRQTVHNLGY